METLPSRAPFFLASITFKPLLRRQPNMPMHNLRNSASFMDTVESAHLLCNYTKHQSYHQLLGSGCLLGSGSGQTGRLRFGQMVGKIRDW